MNPNDNTVTPTLGDGTIGKPPAAPRVNSQAEDEAGEPPPLGQRLGDWKTIVSFGLAIVILALVVYIGIKHGFSPSQIWQRLRNANWAFFVVGAAIYYVTFPLRGLRWKVLLANAYRDSHSGEVADMHLSGLTQIISISWFVNCVVPAKLGDLYRAYLAKLWQHISWVKTVGTVVAERIVDILVMALLLAASGLIAFHGRLGSIKIILGLGLGLAILGIIVLTMMRQLSPMIRRVIPTRFNERYGAFEEGTLLSLRRLPLVFALTVPIWLLEGARIQFMFLALHINLGSITPFPYAAALFFALATAVLTTIPFTPGGLGVVQSGLLGVMVLLGLTKNAAGAVVIMDNLVSYWSIALVGFVVYLLSKHSHFRVAT